MRKLFRANCYHLFRDKIFWIEMLGSALFFVYVLFANYSAQIQSSANRLYLDDLFFNMYQILIIILAASISLITGTEYSDGTIRNKLAVGYTREEVYLSTLLMHMMCGCFLVAIHGIVTYSIGYFLFSKLHITFAQLIIALVCVTLNVWVFTTLFTAITMNCSNKSIAAVSSLLFALAIITAANSIHIILLEPKTTLDGVTITANGVQYGNEIPNPAYVSGLKRKIFEFFHNFPEGQMMRITTSELTHWKQWIVFSASLFIGITSAGFWLFRKKDIK